MDAFQTQFTLTRDYLAESFDESLPHSRATSPNFLFPAVLFVAGAGLLVFTEQPEIAGWAFVAMCVLELLHIKFRRGWWLFRQTWGKNSDIEVTLTIDDDGVQTKSLFAATTVAWSELNHVIDTGRGIVLVTEGSQQYISKSVLTQPTIDRLLTNPP